jgi:predicted GNAT family N-acyltransferase
MQATTHLSPLNIGCSQWPLPAIELRDTCRTHQVSALDESRLSVRVLGTDEDRRAIAELRMLAAFGVESDLELELAPLEKARDEIGMVTAISRGQKVIATTRCVPTGYGMTAAERLQRIFGIGTQTFGRHSWEVGRIIMKPEERNPALLSLCLRLALTELLKQESPLHLHASTTLPMARLWRRFGMKTAATIQGASGECYALVEGDVAKLAAALDVPYSRRRQNTASEGLPMDYLSMCAPTEASRFSACPATQSA